MIISDDETLVPEGIEFEPESGEFDRVVDIRRIADQHRFDTFARRVAENHRMNQILYDGGCGGPAKTAVEFGEIESIELEPVVANSAGSS